MRHLPSSLQITSERGGLYSAISPLAYLSIYHQILWMKICQSSNQRMDRSFPLSMGTSCATWSTLIEIPSTKLKSSTPLNKLTKSISPRISNSSLAWVEELIHNIMLVVQQTADIDKCKRNSNITTKMYNSNKMHIGRITALVVLALNSHQHNSITISNLKYIHTNRNQQLEHSQDSTTTTNLISPVHRTK